MNPLIRLNKLLSKHGLCSRRKADEWIKAGRVSIDGIRCSEVGTTIDPAIHTVAVDGRPLDTAPKLEYIALYKPTDVITTRSDPQGRKTVMDLVDKEFHDAGLYPVGRLDSDSEGLQLMTNNGEWNQILLHPSHQIWKVYQVTTDQPLTKEGRVRLIQGVTVDGSITLPAKVDLNDCGKRQFTISIREGRNRQIRKMCKRIRLEVVRLKRLQIGPIRLGRIRPGEWRRLTRDEIRAIFKLGRSIENMRSTS